MARPWVRYTQVQPSAGLCVVFQQPPGAALQHDGEEVSAGVKYLFRSDVMYARRRSIEPEPEIHNTE